MEGSKIKASSKTSGKKETIERVINLKIKGQSLKLKFFISTSIGECRCKYKNIIEPDRKCLNDFVE